MLSKTLNILALLLVAPIFAQDELPPIRNFLRVNKEFCTGGQPRLEHLPKLKDETRLSSWLGTTTTRHCILERERKLLDPSSAGEDFEEPAFSDKNMELVRNQALDQQNIRDAVAMLPERCRRLMEMLYFDAENPSYEAIARTLRMPVSAIGPNRARCIEELRKLLRRRRMLEK